MTAPAQPIGWTDVQLDELAQLYADGTRIKDIRKLLHRSRFQVSDGIRRLRARDADFAQRQQGRPRNPDDANDPGELDSDGVIGSRRLAEAIWAYFECYTERAAA